MAPKLELDHLVVSAETLQDGVDYVQDRLGVQMAPGGKHGVMGTHNRLLGLGNAYLEVIAIDPEASPPAHARWFDLDNFSGPPRLTNWVAKCTDLAAALVVAPEGAGKPMQVSRGELTWQIAVSDDGALPFDGAFPGFINWGDAAHPTTRLPETGCNLRQVTISHPEPSALAAALGVYGGGFRNWVGPAAAFEISAEIDTPQGPRRLL